MTITVQKAASIITLVKRAKWGALRTANDMKCCENTVRNVLADPVRAVSVRTRVRRAVEVGARRKLVNTIAKKLKFVVREGERVICGKQFPSCIRILAEYVRITKITTCKSTIHVDLQALGYFSRVRPKVVNNDPKKNRLRLAFARAHARDDPRKIIFSDECWVTTNDNTNRREWILAGEDPTERAFQKRAAIKVMIWGAIGYNYKSKLLFVVGAVDAESYQRDILPEIVSAMRRRPGTLFMQDNARPHSARSTQEFLAARGVKVLDWPAYSPHLNPIEHLWNLIHYRIALKQPESLDDLKRCAQEVWDELTMASINNYVEAFADKLKLTKEKLGAPW